jgi:hypothetical protein
MESAQIIVMLDVYYALFLIQHVHYVKQTTICIQMLTVIQIVQVISHMPISQLLPVILMDHAMSVT